MEVPLRQRSSIFVFLALGVVGGAGSFVLMTILANRISDFVVIGASALGAAAAALLLSPRNGPFQLREIRLSRDWPALAGGALSFWIAPLVALSQRLTDAPTGTESAFFTTAAWGFVTVLVAVVASRRSSSGPGATTLVLAGAVASVVGSAVLLASWERPSSFSPLVRFARQEIIMVLAGLLFAAGLLALNWYARRHDWSRAARLAGLSAGVLGASLALPAILQDFATVAFYETALVVLAVFSAMFAHGVLGLARQRGVGHSAIVWFMAPPALTALSFIERMVGVRGPDPVRWASAGAGIAVALAGAVVVWLGLSASRAFPVEDSSFPRRGFAFAAIMVAAGSALALAVPTMQGEVIASLAEPFHIRWNMYGIETAAGWITTSAGLLAASALLGSRRGLTKEGTAAVLAVLISAAAYPFVSDTPLRTWTNWVPGDIQQVYGTDYARLTFTPVSSPFLLALLALAVFTAIVSFVISRQRSKATRTGSEG